MDHKMNELREINFEQKHFECQGRKFTVREVPSFERFKAMQRICLEFGFSTSFTDMYKNIAQAYELLNKPKFADAAVILHNVLYGIVSATEDKYPAALRLCALFIDEEGEDPTVYDEGMMNEKISCWGKELDPLPFFHLASNLVEGWMPVYNNFIQSGLPKVVTQEKS